MRSTLTGVTGKHVVQLRVDLFTSVQLVHFLCWEQSLTLEQNPRPRGSFCQYLVSYSRIALVDDYTFRPLSVHSLLLSFNGLNVLSSCMYLNYFLIKRRSVSQCSPLNIQSLLFPLCQIVLEVNMIHSSLRHLAGIAVRNIQHCSGAGVLQ